MRNKTMKRILAAMLVLVCCMMCAACGSKEPNPNAGVYNAYTAEMMGLTIGVESVYPDGFSIELKDGDKCRITVGADSASGKWALDGSSISISGGGVELEGTLENGLMTFDDVMGSGLTMTFLLEGAEAPDYTSAEEILEALEGLNAELENAS